MQSCKKEYEKYLFSLWTRLKMLLNSVLQSQKYICSLDGLHKRLSSIKIYNDKLYTKLVELQRECFAVNLDKKMEYSIKFDFNKAQLNPTILTTTNFYSKMDVYEEYTIDCLHSNVALDEHSFEIVFYLDCIKLALTILYNCTQLVIIIQSLPLLISFVSNDNINQRLTTSIMYAKHLAYMELCLGCVDIIDPKDRIEVLNKLYTSFQRLKLNEQIMKIDCDDTLGKAKNYLFHQIILFNNELCNVYANLCLSQYHLMTLSYLPLLLTLSKFKKSYKKICTLSELPYNIDMCPPWIQSANEKCLSETEKYQALNLTECQSAKFTNINTIIKRWWKGRDEMEDNKLLSLPIERNVFAETQEIFQFNQKTLSKDRDHSNKVNLNIIGWAKSYQVHLASKAALYFSSSLDSPINMSYNNTFKSNSKTNLFEINDKLARFQKDMGAHVVCIILDKSKFKTNVNSLHQKTVLTHVENSKVSLDQIFADVNASLISPYTYDSVLSSKSETLSGLQTSYALLAQSPEGNSEHLFRTYLPSFVMLVHRYYDLEPNVDPKPDVDRKVICHLCFGDTNCHIICRATEFACLSKHCYCCPDPKKKNLTSNYLTQQAVQRQNYLPDTHSKFATIHSASYEEDGANAKRNNAEEQGKRPSLFSLFSNHMVSSSSSNVKRCESAASQELLAKSEAPSPESNRLFWVGSFNEGFLGGLTPARPLINFESRDPPRQPSNGVTLCCQEPIRWEHANLSSKVIHQSGAPFTTHSFYDKALGQTYVICNLEYNHTFLLIVLPGEVSSDYMNSPAPGKVFKESTLENTIPGTGEDALNYAKQASLRNFLLYLRQKLDSSLEMEKLACIFAA